MSTQIVNIQPLSQPVDLGVEPATFSPEVEAEIDGHLAKYPVMRSAILPLMFIVQRERGYLDPPGVLYLANRLQLRVTDIWEVATFYSMIHTEPVGKYHIQICKTCPARSEAQARSLNTVRTSSESNLAKRPLTVVSRFPKLSVSDPAARRRCFKSTSTITRI